MLPMAEACAPASTAAGSSDSSTRSQHDGEQLRNLRCLVPAGAGTANPTIIRDYARWLANYRLLFSTEPLCCTSFALLAVRSSSIKISAFRAKFGLRDIWLICTFRSRYRGKEVAAAKTTRNPATIGEVAA